MYSPTRKIFQLAGFAAMALISGVHGHSWIDSLKVVSGGNNGPFQNTTTIKEGPQGTGVGYIRAYQGHVDATAVYLITAPNLDSNICRPSQQQNPTTNTPKFPRLSASPGDFIQGTYLENGHISKPEAPDGTPGTIFWFGTTNAKPDDTLANVKQWSVDGKGGDGRGRLLANPSNFDDGKCFEPNDSPIAKQRKASGGGGACKSVFKLPEDAKVGSTFTVYWVWDYSNHFGPTKKGHTEWYTSCIDVQVVAPKGKRFWRGSAKFRGRL
ncbi:hypothetical protein HOY80DRAFT_982537 [Tuber brumale]|nr:hypothetical protein HOY80DRAFT_982537 [Tuber brumale]